MLDFGVLRGSLGFRSSWGSLRMFGFWVFMGAFVGSLGAPCPPPPPLQACIDENMEVVQFLVESGADVNQADNEGWTPLHVAASCGYRDIAE